MKEVLGDKVEQIMGSGCMADSGCVLTTSNYIMSELKKKAVMDKTGENKVYYGWGDCARLCLHLL
eukprot:2941748-Heterocapsa_arctica.AAC.1